MAENRLQITLEARNLSTRAFQQLTKDLERIEKGSQAAGITAKKAGGDMEAAFQSAGKEAQSFGAGVADALGVALPLSAAAAGTAIAAIGVNAVQSFMTLDRGLREVNTLFGLTGEASKASFEEISTGVRDFAQRLGVDAVEATQALYQAISAGVPRENALTFLEIATKAAIGGVTDTKTAVDGLTTVINAFRLPMSDAQRVADVMFTTVRLGKTTFEELSHSMFQVAPLAASAGISFEETAAAIAALTQQGVPTAEAMTRVRGAIQAIIKPSDEAQKIAEALGLQFDATALATNGLKNTFDDIHEATGGDIEILGKLFGSVEGLGAVLSLTGEKAEAFGDAIHETENAAGSATLAYEEMEQSGARSFERLGAKVNELKLQLGEKLLPVANDVVTVIDLIGQKLGLWPTTPPPAEQIDRFNKLALAASFAAQSISTVWEALTSGKTIQQVAIENIGRQIDASLKQAEALSTLSEAEKELQQQFNTGKITLGEYHERLTTIKPRAYEAAEALQRLQGEGRDETAALQEMTEALGAQEKQLEQTGKATDEEKERAKAAAREKLRLAQEQQRAGRDAAAVAYLVNRAHPQYARGLTLDDQLALVRRSHGKSGPNTDYVVATVKALESLGIRDPGLSYLTQHLTASHALPPVLPDDAEGEGSP